MSEENTKVDNLEMWTPIGLNKGSVPFYPRGTVSVGEGLSYVDQGVFTATEFPDAGSGGVIGTTRYSLENSAGRDPRSGRFSYVGAQTDSPITIKMSTISGLGSDITNFIEAQVSATDQLVIQQANDSNVLQDWVITSIDLDVTNDWFNIVVTGTNTEVFSNSTECLLIFIRP